MVFGALALAVCKLVGESGLIYFSVLALLIAVLMWRLGGARGLWSALKRSLVAATLTPTISRPSNADNPRSWSKPSRLQVVKQRKRR
ncbi:MAG: hypothetical protein F7B20_07635 [Aeropyrum sp.]|nr:hypothetical protein [Aeropyrum sp.]MCE4615673.1 hypothetical protein [Aeropyrum sp.]